jgi:hypothetical protein
MDEPERRNGRFGGRTALAVAVAAGVFGVASLASGATVGALTYKGCLTGRTLAGPVSGGGSGACKVIPQASMNGTDSGLSTPLGVATSADGKSVYAAAWNDDAVARFKRARSGALTYKGCITGDSLAGPVSGGGSGACKAVTHASTNGTDSGLDGPRGIAVSGDGKSVYLLSESDDAISRFRRARSGALTYKGCITGETESGPATGGGSGACRSIPHASTNGVASGFDRLRAAVVSADGRSVYALAGSDDAVARFKRARSGALTYKGCITGDKNAGPVSGGGSGACKAIPHASTFGAASGLDSPEQLVAAGNGRSVYVVTQLGDDVARFSRSKSGVLTFKSCVTGDTLVGPVSGGGSGACKAIPHASSGGSASGLHDLHGVALGGGKSLYTGSTADDAVARFSRSKSGVLTYKGCITGDTLVGPVSGGGSGACKVIPHASMNGTDSGLDRLSSVVASGDHRSVYSAALQDSAVARFKRARSGALTYKGCITGETGSGPATGGGSGACKAIPHASTGGGNSGLGGITFLALSRDGKSLYAAAAGDSSIARFKRQR